MSDARLPPVCLLAGGRGTRLGAHVEEVPKPLVDVGGEPFLFHVLRLLRRHGADQVVICVGYLGERIVEAVGDGSAFGLQVAYSHDGAEPLGTGGAVRQAALRLGDEFLVLYGDTYLLIDYRAVVDAFRASGQPALMTVLRNEGRWDTSNAAYDGKLVRYDKSHPSPDMSWIDYGLGVLSAEALDALPPGRADLADLYGALSRSGRLAGFEAAERFYEIGTPAALAETRRFLTGS